MKVDASVDSPSTAADPSGAPGTGESTLGHVATSAVYTIVSVLVFGIAYPTIVAGLGAVIFPDQAGGSLVRSGKTVIASDIIGQSWRNGGDFVGRPSAAGKEGYDPTATGGTNLGPTNKKLIVQTRAAIAALREAGSATRLPIPMDLVTSSGSGIDPDISPEAAFFQAPRVAKARHLSVAAVDAVIRKYTHGRELGFLGEPRVNVFELNFALHSRRSP